MIVKCTKTGKILANEEEIREHSDAFGVCAFEEIDPAQTKLWMNTQTGKYCFSKNELEVFLRRSGESAESFSEVTVAEFLKVRSSKQKERRNDAKVEQFAKSKLLNALVDVKGYSVVPAEKALWFTKNESLNAAEDWLKSHATDLDFNTPLKLSPECATPIEEGIIESREPETDSSVTKLSKEEAQMAALELQRKLREERVLREANEEKEKERLRIIQTKQMLEHQAQVEESNRIREIANREREKKLAEQHKAELAEKIRLDFIERFGYEPPNEKVVEKSPKEMILSKLNVIKKSYPSNSVILCLSLLRAYLSNIASNSTDKKYHKIRKTNASFSEKISKIPEAIEILQFCGFESNETELEIKAAIADGFLCAQTVKYIDVILNALS